MRHRNLLAAAVLLLCTGSLGASALPFSERVDGAPTVVDPVQYNDGGRCFNQCVVGIIFRRCQTPTDGNIANCCSEHCTRLNNDVYRARRAFFGPRAAR